MAYADSTHPLDEVNAEFASRTARSTDQPVSLGPPDGSGWVLASDLLTDDGILRETLERYGAHWRTPRPFLQAALLMFPYIAPVVSAAVLGLYSRKRVPDVSAENYAIRFDESGDIVEHTFISRRFAALSTDPAAGHADATTLPDFESLIGWMYYQMVERHMHPLFERVTQRTKLSQNVMWSALAGRCAETLIGLQRTGYFTIGEAIAEKKALMERAPSPMWNRVSVYPLQSGNHESLFMRIEVCCQKYLHPDLGKCGYCGLRSIPEQLQLQQSVFDRQVSEPHRREGASSQQTQAQ